MPRVTIIDKLHSPHERLEKVRNRSVLSIQFTVGEGGISLPGGKLWLSDHVSGKIGARLGDGRPRFRNDIGWVSFGSTCPTRLANDVPDLQTSGIGMAAKAGSSPDDSNRH